MSASLRAGNSSDGYLQIDGADIVDITASGMAPSSGKTLIPSDNAITTAKIANANVTYAKIQNVSAASKLLGRGSAGGAGSPEEITIGTGLSMSGTTLAATAGFTLGTKVTTSGAASYTFTGIPAGTKMIVISAQGVSGSTSANIGVQLGDSGGLEATGYSSSTYNTAGSHNFYTTYFGVQNAFAAAYVTNFTAILSLVDAATYSWSFMVIPTPTTAVGSEVIGSGYKALSAELDRVAVLVSAGTFDAGTVNISYI